MRIVRSFHGHRAAWILGLAGLFGLAEGCGGEPASTAPVATTDTKAQEEAQRAAREKAYGTKANNPPSTAAKKK